MTDVQIGHPVALEMTWTLPPWCLGSPLHHKSRYGSGVATPGGADHGAVQVEAAPAPSLIWSSAAAESSALRQHIDTRV